MKKLITGVIAAAAILFGFASCAGNLHDAEIIDLTGYGVHGTPNGWSDGSEIPLVDNGDGTYSASWTAQLGGQNSDATGEAFAIRIINDTGWSSAYRLAQPKSEGDTANVFKTNGDAQNVYQGQSADCMVISDAIVSAGDTIKITVTPGTTSLSVKVDVTSGSGTTVSPYYLDGMFLVGGVFKTTGNENAYNFSTENLLWGATTDNQTGVVTYTKDITAIAASGEMAINDSTWNNNTKWGGADITVNADNVAVELINSKDNFKVAGLTVDSPYRVTITTTPEKKVSVSIKAIVRYTITFEITGLSEGNAAWINGTFWGSSWPNGWPITGWNSTPNETLAAAIPEAKSDGVATFAAAWNVTGIAEPGENLSFTFKSIATTSKDTWNTDKANILNPSGDLLCEIENVEAATYKVSIDAETQDVTVTKS